MASATNFKEYMYSLGGEVITNEFFNDYPEKVWSIKPEEMLPDWAPKRIRICKQQTPFFSDQYCGISAKGTESPDGYPQRGNSSAWKSSSLQERK